MSVRGTVLSYDACRGVARTRLDDDRYADMHTAAFRSGRPNRHPQCGDVFDCTVEDDAAAHRLRVTSARKVDSVTLGREFWASCEKAAAIHDGGAMKKATNKTDTEKPLRMRSYAELVTSGEMQLLLVSVESLLDHSVAEMLSMQRAPSNDFHSGATGALLYMKKHVRLMLEDIGRIKADFGRPTGQRQDKPHKRKRQTRRKPK